MAQSAGISVGRCIGDWLTDTADGAQFVAQKMQEAKRAPKTVMREMQAMAHGLHGEVSEVLDDLRRRGEEGRDGRAAAGRAPSTAPSSNTGLKSPARGGRGR
jgi:hypothetical protein